MFDWVGLPPLLMEKVAGCLLDVDVADFLRFCAVCIWWRGGTKNSCLLGVGIINHRFHPRRWILRTEPAAGAMRCNLLNMTTTNVLEVDLPELNGHAMVSGPQRPQELEQQHLQLVVAVDMNRQFLHCQYGR